MGVLPQEAWQGIHGLGQGGKLGEQFKCAIFNKTE